MAFNPPGQRQGLLTNMPAFSSLSHNRPAIHQHSPTPGSIHPVQSNLSGPASRGTPIGLNHFGNTTGMAVGHLPSSHSQTQQQISNQPEASLDPSDFPALGAGAPSSTSLSHNALSYASHVNLTASNALSVDRTVAATIAGQRTDFTADDFPALDASVSQQQQQQQASESAAREAREQASAAAALTAQMARFSVQNKPTPISESDNRNQPNPESSGGGGGTENRSGGSDPSSQPTPLLDYAGSLDSLSQNANCNSSVVPFFAPQTPAEQVLFGPADRFGLMNLLHIIRHADADYSMLALGKDLTHLGLDLGSSEALYPKFMTPWSDAKQVASHAVEPEFILPACYHVQPQPVQTKLPQFHEETLFFIFYSQPRDLMQELAALELYKKNWRYHKELQLWLTKESGTGPMEKTPHYERGFYVFFDPVIWKRVTKEFVLQYDQLEAKPALATNPAALQAATQLSLVYTSNGPHGKISLTASSNSSQPQQTSQSSQQQQTILEQQQLRVTNGNSTQHPNPNPNHLIVPNNIPPNLIPV